jgi:hypothetical protein
LDRRTHNREECSEQIHRDIDALWTEHRALREDFYRHEAIVEERWKTVFNELRDFQRDTRDTTKEMKIRIDSIFKLILAVSGTSIIFLITELFERGLK